jgi:hypothetical protein
MVGQTGFQKQEARGSRTDMKINEETLGKEKQPH